MKIKIIFFMLVLLQLCYGFDPIYSKHSETLESWQVVGEKPKDTRHLRAYTLQDNDVVLTDVSPLDWAYGCSATSAAMIAGYYDRKQYREMYNSANNEFPISTESEPVWTTTDHFNCPLSATQNGIDGRTTDGHVDHFFVSSGSSGNDPNAAAAQSSYEDCTADFMGTSQDYWNNVDGGTTFFYDTDGGKLYDYSGHEGETERRRDGAHGLRLFLESRGYKVKNVDGEYQIYNQYVNGYNGNVNGFTFEDYKQEIDAGRPVLIHIVGHTMCGVGYNDENGNERVILFNTWGFYYDEMTWGGTYSGEVQTSVTVIELDEIPTISETEQVSGVLSHRANFSYEISDAGNSSVASQGYFISTSQNAEENGTKIEKINGIGSYNETITGLLENTVYYIRAYSENNGGIAYGLEKTFTTTAEINSQTETESVSNGDITSPIVFTETPVSITLSNVQNATENNDITVDEIAEVPQNMGALLLNEDTTSSCSIVITQNSSFTFDEAEVRFNIQDVDLLDSSFINETDFSMMENDVATAIKLWKRDNYQTGDFALVGTLKYHDNDGINGNGDDYLYHAVNSFSEFTFSKDSEETLPVELSNFYCASTETDEVRVVWQTESETNHLGYNLYRNNEPNLATALKLNNMLIYGGSLNGNSYEFLDSTVHNTTFYWLESIDLDGTTEYYGPVQYSIEAIESISFSNFEMALDYPSISLNWDTDYENLDVVYFNIFRSENNLFDDAIKVNSDPIFCDNLENGSTYSFTDNTIEAGSSYRYWIAVHNWSEVIQVIQGEELNIPYYDIDFNVSTANNAFLILLQSNYFAMDTRMNVFIKKEDGDYLIALTDYFQKNENFQAMEYELDLDYDASFIGLKIDFICDGRTFTESLEKIDLSRKNRFVSVFPNPYRANERSNGIHIHYEIFNNTSTNIEIFNIKGQKVKTMINNHTDNGYHDIVWDMKNSENETVSNGVYFIKMKAKNDNQVKKITIVK